MSRDIQAEPRALAPDLWVTEHPLRFLGVEVGARMTVIRLADGSLFVHSPIALGADVAKRLDSLGRVAYVVAPNRFHHLWVPEFASAYPEARLFAAPGLPEKRRDIGFHAVLDDAAPLAWVGQMDQLLFRGAPLANEVVFCHRKSRTLLLCDLALHIGPESPPWTRLSFRLLGAYGRFGPTRFEKWVVVRDRAEARQSLERILEWDFDRVIVAHGAVLERGGREALRRGYAWLLEE